MAITGCVAIGGGNSSVFRRKKVLCNKYADESTFIRILITYKIIRPYYGKASPMKKRKETVYQG